ncbi:MAG: hypothetical protein FWC73_08450 [Defluviitaleaceae bacterium]|nr:hypothetical protein [Defluviitaleaceae bacterium]
MSDKFNTHWGNQITTGLMNTIDNVIVSDPVNINNFVPPGSNILVDFTGVKVGETNEKSTNTNQIHGNVNSLILLNVDDPQALAGIIGFGIGGQVVIVRPQDNFCSVYVLRADEDELTACCKSEVIQYDDGSYHFSVTDSDNACCSNSTGVSFQSLCVPDQVNMISNIIATDFKVPERSEPCCIHALSNNPAVLPPHQLRLVYLTIDAKWNLDTHQVTSNSVVLEISLIASFNPAYKYLRIRSLGAGFSPTNGATFSPDTAYDKGYIQSMANLHFAPQTNKLTVLSTDPKNVNARHTYTAGSSFSVGVDISKNPSFNPSYTISNSETREISDFNIYNNSAGVVADWDFKFSMIEKSVWDAFSQPFMRKGRVKDMPALATRNMQTVTDTVWYGPSSLTDTIGMQLYWKTNHHKFWVTGNWSNYTMHSRRAEKRVGHVDLPFYIDFGSVFA